MVSLTPTSKRQQISSNNNNNKYIWITDTHVRVENISFSFIHLLAQLNNVDGL